MPMEYSMEKARSIQIDGLTLKSEERGSGPPLVFAHGLTGNRGGVFEQLEGLTDRYRIIAYDHRGHGDSTPVRNPKLYDPHLMAEDMAAVMDALGVESAIVGGESMGAATTLLFALKHPARVKALLLTAPAFGDTPNADREHILSMGEDIDRLGIEGYIEASSRDILEKGLPKELAETMARRLRTHDRISIATACKTVIDWKVFEDLEVIRDIDVKTCIIAWRDDQLHPFDLAERMASLIPQAVLLEHDLGKLFVHPESTGRMYGEFLYSHQNGVRPTA